jgi:hypothetical protein
MTQFHVLGKGLVELGSLTVQANIIGASHVVSVKHGGAELHEVFACLNVDGQPAFLRPSPEIVVPVTLDLPGFSYRFTRSILSAPEAGNPFQTVASIEKSLECLPPNQIGISFTFPTSGNEVSPKTIVCVSATRSQVIVSTHHAYPNEGVVVQTLSCIVPKEGTT